MNTRSSRAAGGGLCCLLLAALLGAQAGQPALAADQLTAEAGAAVEAATVAPLIHPKIQRFIPWRRDVRLSAAMLRQLRLPDERSGGTEARGIQVIVEAASESVVPAVRGRIESLGGVVEGAFGAAVQARLPQGALPALADADQVAFIRLPVRAAGPQAAAGVGGEGPVVSEGAAEIEAQRWHAAGQTGAGATVGILDTFRAYEDLLGTELPGADRVLAESFAASGEMFSEGVDPGLAVHGTGVAEIVHDVAPDAGLVLAYFDTDVELRRAIDGLISRGVDVVNTSLGLFSGCLGDVGGSILEPQLARAREAGITWVTASSNEGNRQHYHGQFADADEDGRHDFTETDETINLDVVMFQDEIDGTRVAVGFVVLDFGWSAACGGAADAYDVAFSVAESAPATVREGLETASDWMWRPGYPVKGAFAAIVSEDLSLVGSRQVLQVSVVKLRQDAPDADFELLIEQCSCLFNTAEYLTSTGSVSLIEPSQSPNTVGVGAFHQAPNRCSRSLCPDGLLLAYSSKGPTPYGDVKPNLAAPTHVSTVSFGAYTGDQAGGNSGFTGTSAASPHAAGAAALVKGAYPGFTPAQVQAFLEARAADAGLPGRDNAYGAGLLRMGQPPTADATPPAAPAALAIDPAGWTNGAVFNVTWQAAPGEEAVAAAWFALGEPPSAPDDGVRVTQNPFVVAPAGEGELSLYVWLEDVSGNASQLNRAQGVLRRDVSPPTGALAIDGGVPVTFDRNVELTLSVEDTGGSGVAEVRLSRDGVFWGPYQPFSERLAFELDAGSGRKRVAAQFRDLAGNVSPAVAAEIDLREPVELRPDEVFEETLAPQGLSSAYAIAVPAHTARLVVKVRSLDLGDVDLYVRRGEPFVSAGDLASGVAATSPAASEALTLTAPEAGTVYVAVVNKTDRPQTVVLAASWSTAYVPAVETLRPGSDVRGSTPAAVGLAPVQYAVEVADGAQTLSLLLSCLGPGDLRLYVRYGEPVGWTNGQAVSDWQSGARSGLASLALLGTALRQGTYYVAVENLEPYAQDFELTVDET